MFLCVLFGGGVIFLCGVGIIWLNFRGGVECWVGLCGLYGGVGWLGKGQGGWGWV